MKVNKNIYIATYDKTNNKVVSDKKLLSKIIEKVYSNIFKLSDDDLCIHYEEVKKELERRGVLK